MFNIKESAKHIGIGMLQHAGGLMAGAIIALLSILIAWFVSLGERPMARADWVVFTLGSAVALTIVLCGVVWVYPRCLVIWRERFPKKGKKSTDKPPRNHPPAVFHQLPAYEVEEMLKAADQVSSLTNQTQEAIDFVYDTRNKTIAMLGLGHGPSIEAAVFDLGRCRDHVEVLRSKMDVFCGHTQKYPELTEIFDLAPTGELVAAIEHFRTATEKLAFHLELRKGAEPSTFSYLLQPFLDELGSAMSALGKWRKEAIRTILQIRKDLLQ